MEQLPDTNPYRIHLVKMLHGIADIIPMNMPDIVLIMMDLNTEEKIEQFTDWVRAKFDGQSLNATAREVVRAAVWIGQGRADLP